METVKLEANYRSDMSKGHKKEIRRQGYVTGSVFGHDSESISVEVKLEDIARQTKHADGGLKSLIDMKIEGGPKDASGLVIIKEFFKDPMTRKVLDIQFQRVSRKEKLNVGIPIVLIGEAIGLKSGGMIELILDEISVNCLPTDIPSRIEIDVTDLESGHHICIKDLKVEGDVEVLGDPESIVCNCKAPHGMLEAEKTEEAAEPAAPAAE